jgi:hypothetical protein
VIARAVVLATTLLTLGAYPVARQGQGDAGIVARPISGSSADDSMWSALSPPIGKEPFDEVHCAKELVRRGAELAGPAIRIYLGDLQEPAHDYEVDPKAIDARPRILVAVLKGLPKPDVLRAIELESQAKEGVDRQLLLVRLLAEVGGREALDRIVAIASRFDPMQWERTFVQVPVQDSIARLVRGDLELQKGIAREAQNAKPALAAMFVRAIAQAGGSAAAPDLTYSLGRDPRLDLCLAEALGALAENAAGTLSETALAALRSQLESTDARMVCAAATALGRLGDEMCAVKLVRLLGDPDAMKKHGALTALCALSGRDRSGERADWEAWLEAENRWKSERLPELERAIANEELAALPDVLTELVAHRLYRHHIAMDLTPMLGSSNPDVVRLACGILPALGSRSVVPALRSVVRGADRDMIPFARAALIALTPAIAGP